MRAFRDLSYRIKVPLAASVLIIAVAAIVATVLGTRIYSDARSDLMSNAQSLGRALARALSPVMLRDDVWQAYETIMAPLGDEGGADGHRSITVIDSEGKVYVSSDPRHLAMMTGASQAFGKPGDALFPAGHATSAERVVEDPSNDAIFVVVPIVADDGARLGSIVLSYSRDILLPKFFSTVRRVVFSTLVALAILVPLGWKFGRQVASPLVDLANAMTRVAENPSARVTPQLQHGDDEIGRLGKRFEHMLAELEDKRRLERAMIAADRLAAIGRLTSGIAHEINNPLAGMLTAIDTSRKHGAADPVVAKTLSLVERGLQQIRHTVGALLVEAKLEMRAVTPEDIEDVRTLLEPEAVARQQKLRWHCDMDASVPLPSTSIRQVLINLGLNAIQAAGQGGNVSCSIAARPGAMSLEVRNDGRTIPAEQLEHLFEPFSSTSLTGSGLGLWVTYQIVEQLRGTIQVRSDPPETEFSVALPIAAAA